MFTRQYSGTKLDDHSHKQDQLHRRWLEALQQMRYELDPSDLVDLDAFRDPDTMMNSLERQFPMTSTGGVGRWRPILRTIERASLFFAAATMSDQPVESKILWGLMHLVLMISVEMNEFFEILAGMHDRIKVALDRINSDLKSEGVSQNADVAEALLEAFKSLIRFWVKAVSVLRTEHRRMRNVRWASRFPDMIRAVYDESLLKLKNASDLIRTVAESQAQLPVLSKLSLVSSRQSSHASASSTTLILIPYPPNLHFTGRKELLIQLGECLAPSEDRITQKAALLHGMKGIGKTQTALHFAHMAHASGLFSVVFWIGCETERMIQQGIADIATELKLIDQGRSGDVNENRQAVFKWLRESDSNWLIIFDNVELTSRMNDYWPPSSGSVLLTSHDSLAARTYQPRRFEVQPLDRIDSRNLLCQLLEEKSTEQDEGAVSAILDHMSGYSLGIAQMAGLMNEQHLSVTDFAESYTAYPDELHEIAVEQSAGYQHSISTVWSMSFKSVKSNKDQYTFLGIMSYLYPDEIPFAIFVPQKEVAALLPRELAGFSASNKIRLEFQILKPLMTLALVNRSGYTISMHRLTQQAFLSSCDDATLQTLFDQATLLLYHAFPHSDNGLPLVTDWPLCAALTTHVSHLLDRWNELRNRGRQLDGNPTILLLLQAATWYLYETADAPEALRLLDLHFQIVPETKSLSFAQIKHTQGSCYVTLNELHKGKSALETSLKMRTTLLGPDHPSTARTMNLLGVVHNALGDPEKALANFSIVEPIRRAAGNEMLLAVTWSTTAFAHYRLGNLHTALELHNQADAVFGRAGEKDKLLDINKGHNDLALGNVLRAMGRPGDALLTWQRAETLLRRDRLTPTLRASLLYKIGQVRLQLDEWRSAQSVLEEAMETFRGWKSEGNIARAARQLARCARAQLEDRSRDEMATMDGHLEEEAERMEELAQRLSAKLVVQFQLPEKEPERQRNPADEFSSWDELVGPFFR